MAEPLGHGLHHLGWTVDARQWLPALAQVLTQRACGGNRHRSHHEVEGSRAQGRTDNALTVVHRPPVLAVVPPPGQHAGRDGSEQVGPDRVRPPVGLRHVQELLGAGVLDDLHVLPLS